MRTTAIGMTALIMVVSAPVQGQAQGSPGERIAAQGQQQFEAPSISVTGEQTDTEALIQILAPAAVPIILDCLLHDPCLLDRGRDALRRLYCPLTSVDFRTANGFFRERVNRVRSWEEDPETGTTVLKLRSGEEVEIADTLSEATEKLRCQQQSPPPTKR